MKVPFRMLPLALVVLAVSGCSTMDNPKSAFNSAPLKAEDYVKPSFAKKADPTNSQLLMQSGTEYLQQGDLQKAHSVFSVALKVDIRNAGLHFLNGLTYQMMYEAGDEASYDLAVTGYNTALSLDANLEPALLQLGHLHLFAKKYDLAQKAFSEAYTSNSKSTRALMGLAQSSILSGDVKSGYWATVQLDKLNFNSPEFVRLKAIQAALAQSPEKAKDYARQYALVAKARGSSNDADYVNTRVDNLLSMKTSFGSSGINGMQLAQADTSNKSKEAPKEAPKEETKTPNISCGGVATRLLDCLYKKMVCRNFNCQQQKKTQQH